MLYSYCIFVSALLTVNTSDSHDMYISTVPTIDNYDDMHSDGCVLTC